MIDTVYNALLASVIGGSIAEGITACTEFIYTPRVGSDEKNVAFFDRMFPRDKNCRTIPDISAGWLPVAVRGLRPPENDNTVYISGPFTSTDDAERTVECLSLLERNNYFKDVNDEKIRQKWFESMHAWASDSVYCGFMTIDAFRTPQSYEAYLEVVADPNFKGHFSLSLGPLMQAGPFCLCGDSRPIELVCAMSNAHPIAVEAVRFHYYVNRALYEKRIEMASSEGRIDAEDIRAAISRARTTVGNSDLLRFIDEAIAGNREVLMEKSIIVASKDGIERSVGVESLHAIYSLVYTLMRAEDFKHGLGVGLDLSYQTHNFDTDTIAQINGWVLAHVFGLGGVKEAYGDAAVERWLSFDPSDEKAYAETVEPVIEALKGGGDVSDVVAISEAHLKGIRDGTFGIKPHVRPARYTQKDAIRTIERIAK